MSLVMRISDHVNVLSFGRKIAAGPPGPGAGRPGRDRGLPRGPRTTHDAPCSSSTTSRPATAPCRRSAASRSRCPRATIVAVLGANGAGKTTTLRAISGTVRRSGGITFARQAAPRRAGGGRAGRDRARARGERDVHGADRDREPAARRLHPARPRAPRGHRPDLRVVPVDPRARATSRRGRSPAASSRCSRSRAR